MLHLSQSSYAKDLGKTITLIFTNTNNVLTQVYSDGDYCRTTFVLFNLYGHYKTVRQRKLQNVILTKALLQIPCSTMTNNTCILHCDFILQCCSDTLTTQTEAKEQKCIYSYAEKFNSNLTHYTIIIRLIFQSALMIISIPVFASACHNSFPYHDLFLWFSIRVTAVLLHTLLQLYIRRRKTFQSVKESLIFF